MRHAILRAATAAAAAATTVCFFTVPAAAQPTPSVDTPFTTSIVVSPTVTCHLTQTPEADMTPQLILFPALSEEWIESGQNSSTTDCSATYAVKVTSQVVIDDLGVITHHTAGAIKSGSGYGPVVGTAEQRVNVETGEPGPKVRFTFISTLTTNTGATGRICQSATVNLGGVITSYDPC